MTVQQIRLGLITTGLIVVSVLFNILVLQPEGSRGARPDRSYRGLAGLPGVPSRAIDDATTGMPKAAEAVADTATPAVRPARSGASGEQKLVAAVQDQLAKRGYVPGNATGHLDFVTRAAIMAFEHDKGLELTAVPTGDLLAALRSSVPTPAAGGGPDAASAEAQEVVRAVQRSLSLLNYRPGTVDGVMGKATSAAIRAFERDQKLPESGRISGLLVTRLARIGVMDRVAAR